MTASRTPRVTIFADGILFRHPDPDALDLAIGQLAHENPEVEFVRLGPSTTFAASPDLNGLRRLFEREGGLEVDILGPVPSPMERRAGRYRAQLLLQSTQRPALHALLQQWVTQVEGLKSARQVRWSVDVDPIDMF